MKNCPSCAHEIQDTSIKCHFCGTHLNAEEQAQLKMTRKSQANQIDPQKFQRKRSSSFLKISLLTAGCLLIVSLASMFFIFTFMETTAHSGSKSTHHQELSHALITDENDGLANQPVFEDNLINPSSVNEGNTRIMALSENSRKVFFYAFLKKNGEKCDQAIRTFYQGSEENNTAYWNVECKNKNAYAISIASDEAGSTKITDCKALNQTNHGKDTCFKELSR